MRNRNETIIFHNTAKENGFLWFWGLKEDVLFKAKQNDADIVHLCCYQKKKHTGSLYGKIEKYENKLIGVPLSADEILIYDCHTGTDRYVPLPRHIFNEEFACRGKFWDIVMDERYAYLIGYWSNKILKFDLFKEKISEVLEPDIESGRVCKDIFFKKAALYGDDLVVPSCQANIVYVIDKHSMAYRVREFKGTNDGFASLLIDGGDVWLAPRRNGKFVRWNPETDDADYLEYPEECKTAKPSYGFLEKTENGILAFPLHAKGVLCINPETSELHIDSQLTEICGKEDGRIQKTGFTEIEGKEIIIYSWQEGCFIKCNTKTGSIQKSRIQYADAYYRSIMEKEWERNGYVNEANCPLTIFIHNIEEPQRSAVDEQLYFSVSENRKRGEYRSIWSGECR
ncbi:MAG TPA: hypothetical protein DF613_10510 [Lachnospiraceae bacterium]|nr:hypothetical protein [Lachnospiraceae bacterium]